MQTCAWVRRVDGVFRLLYCYREPINLGSDCWSRTGFRQACRLTTASGPGCAKRGSACPARGIGESRNLPTQPRYQIHPSAVKMAGKYLLVKDVEPALYHVNNGQTLCLGLRQSWPGHGRVPG